MTRRVRCLARAGRAFAVYIDPGPSPDAETYPRIAVVALDDEVAHRRMLPLLAEDDAHRSAIEMFGRPVME